MSTKQLRGFFAGAAFPVIFLFAFIAFAESKDEDKDKEKPPGPAVKMELDQVFPTENYTVVRIKFFDAKGNQTTVKEGNFTWWSNFMKDQRKPAKARQVKLAEADEHNKNYSLKLPGIQKLCPPRVARLRINFNGTDPKRKFNRTWTQKAECR